MHPRMAMHPRAVSEAIGKTPPTCPSLLWQAGSTGSPSRQVRNLLAKLCLEWKVGFRVRKIEPDVFCFGSMPPHTEMMMMMMMMMMMVIVMTMMKRVMMV